MRLSWSIVRRVASSSRLSRLRALEERGIIYAPDYVINAGGLINVYAELKGLPSEKAMADAASIFDTVKRIINLARAEGITTTAASNRVAEARIDAVARLRRLHLPAQDR